MDLSPYNKIIEGYTKFDNFGNDLYTFKSVNHVIISEMIYNYYCDFIFAKYKNIYTFTGDNTRLIMLNQQVNFASVYKLSCFIGEVTHLFMTEHGIILSLFDIFNDSLLMKTNSSKTCSSLVFLRNDKLVYTSNEHKFIPFGNIFLQDSHETNKKITIIDITKTNIYNCDYIINSDENNYFSKASPLGLNNLYYIVKFNKTPEYRRHIIQNIMNKSVNINIFNNKIVRHYYFINKLMYQISYLCNNKYSSTRNFNRMIDFSKIEQSLPYYKKHDYEKYKMFSKLFLLYIFSTLSNELLLIYKHYFIKECLFQKIKHDSYEF